jgi:hypothetical protein
LDILRLPMKKVIFILVLLTGFIVARAQNKSLVVGTLIDRPNAILVINPPGNNQGFLLPQLTTAQRLSIAASSPDDNGLLVYDITEQSFYYWSGSTWIKGLGDSGRVLTYDASTQKLTLGSSGGSADLSALKEIPDISGKPGTYLTTDGVSLTWANISSLGDITAIITGQGLSGGAPSGDVNLSVNTDGTTISVNGTNQLQITDGGVGAAKIAANAVNATHIADGSVTSADILDNTIGANDIAANAVNTTHIADGSVTSADILDNTIGANDIAANAVNSSHIADGSVTGADIQDGSIGTIDLADNAVTTQKIQPGAANQALVTNAAGTATTWVTPGGDVTGALDASTVGKIQGRDVSNAAPNPGDALIWNGTAWVPAVVAVAPATQYYAIDPSAFQGLEPAGNPAPILGLFESDNTFVTAVGSAREIMAPVHLPHGASIQNVTVTYQDNELVGDITVQLIRKSYAGGNQVLSTFSPILVSLVVQTQNMPAVAAANRVVDNATYTYRLRVAFSHLLNYGAAGSAAQKIFGVRVEYIK